MAIILTGHKAQLYWWGSRRLANEHDQKHREYLLHSTQSRIVCISTVSLQY